MLRTFPRVMRRSTSRLASPQPEPAGTVPTLTLAELMDDALTHAVLRSDGLTAAQFWQTVRDAQERL